MARNFRRHHFTRALGLFILVVLIIPSVMSSVVSADDAAVKTYKIQLARLSKVGDQTTVKVSASQKLRNAVTVGGQARPPQEKILSVQFEGTLETLTVDPKGNATSYSCVVKKLTGSEGEDPVDIVPAGSVVIADARPQVDAAPDGAKAKTRFTLKDGSLNAQQSHAMSMVIEAHSPGSPNDDDIFGTKTSQKVGASWPMDTVKAAADLTEPELAIKPENLKGESTLKGVKHLNGIDYLDVKARISTDKVLIPAPPGMKLEQAKMVANFTGMVPSDVSRERLSDTTDTQVDIVFVTQTPDGQPVSIHSTMQAHREAKLMLIDDK